MMKNSFKIFAGIILLLAQVSAYATEGNLFNVVSSGTPALVDITLCLNGKAKLSCEDEKITALDLLISTTVNRMYPDAGIFVNTPGYSIASIGIACSMYDPTGYCIFGVSSATPANISLVNNTVKTPRYAYIGNFSGNTVTQCVINSDGSMGTCTDLQGPSVTPVPVANIFDAPSDVEFDASGKIAYIANYSDGSSSGFVVKCDVGSQGLFSNCINVLDAYGLYRQFPQSVTLNTAGTFAYIGSYDSSVHMIICIVNSTTGALICPNAPLTGPLFDYPSNVLFIASGALAYIGSWDNSQFSYCSVNTSNGQLSACTLTPASANLNEPAGIAFNPAKTIIYSTSSGSNSVFKCPINSDNSVTCTSTGSAFDYPTGIAINDAGTFAYVANYSGDTVTVCQIVADELTNCSATGSFNSPFGITLLY